jgi:hypothetical protein
MAKAVVNHKVAPWQRLKQKQFASVERAKRKRAEARMPQPSSKQGKKSFYGAVAALL